MLHARLFESEPQKSCGVDLLGQYAQAQHTVIEEAENSLAPVYWHLGNTLNIVRGEFSRGHWRPFLNHWGIDITRASRARAIHRKFENADAVEHLSVREACKQSKRTRRKLKNRSNLKPQNDLNLDSNISEWLLDVCRKADFYTNEAGSVHSDQSGLILETIDAAIEELQLLRNKYGKR